MSRNRRGATLSERLATIIYRLLMGERLKAAALADELGTDRRSIYRDFSVISRVVPVFNEKGYWMLCDGADSPYTKGRVA